MTLFQVDTPFPLNIVGASAILIYKENILVELGELLKRDLAGLSQAARRIERRIGTDSLLARKLEGCRGT